MSIDHTEEIRLLAALCRELATQGLDVGMSDAAPALSVRWSRTDPRLWVTVSVRDGCFAWPAEDASRPRHHPATDAPGAAKLIAGDVPRG
jgi:hypothetical protein